MIRLREDILVEIFPRKNNCRLPNLWQKFENDYLYGFDMPYIQFLSVWAASEVLIPLKKKFKERET